MTPDFCTYAYLDPRKPGLFSYDDGFFEFDYEPFYIGKGKENRVLDVHKRRRSSLFVRKYYKIIEEGHKPLSIFIMRGLTEKESFWLEKELIKFIGRSDTGTGPLINFTDGGEGLSGRIVSEETKNKIGKASKGRIFSEVSKAKMSESAKRRPNLLLVYKRTSKDIEKMVNSMKGRKLSDEQKKKISESNKRAYREGRKVSTLLHLPWSLEQRKQQSLRRKGWEPSEESKKKMSEAAKKRGISEETRRKMNESHRRRRIKCVL